MPLPEFVARPAPRAAPLAAPPAAPRPWHGVAIFAAAMTAFLLLPQRTLHGVDGNQFVVWVETGDHSSYARHAAYLHLGGAIYTLLEPLGAGGYLALLVASALGSALGLVFVHRAFALLPSGSATSPSLPTLAVMTTAACFYYATSAEIPGVFAAGAGLAWWAFARWFARPTSLRAALLGLACATAAALHSFGHLLTPSFVAIAFFLRRLTSRSTAPPNWTQLLALGTTHLAAAMLFSLLLAHGASNQAADATSILTEYASTFAPLTTGTVFCREWIVPYLPWSVGALAALCSARARPFGLAALAMLAIHLPLNVLLLGYHQIDESGAYLIGLAPAAVLATAHFVTTRGFAVCLAISAALAITMVAPGWQNPMPPAFGAGIAELNSEHRIALICAGRAELDSARIATKNLVVMDLGSVIGAYMQGQPPRPPFETWFDGWHQNLTLQHIAPLLSQGATDYLRTNKDPGLHHLWYDHIPAHYLLRDVERQGFRGTYLTRRP